MIMKLQCNVEINDRRLLLHQPQRRSQRSILAFAKKSDKDDEVCLYLQTRQNKQGIKYQITKNIEQVFVKFITDGKATIRLREPCQDLIIQGDTIQLKSFLHILNSIINGHTKKQDIEKHVLKPSVTFNSSQFSKEKSIVVVKKKSDYPILQCFPKMTEQLILSGLDRKSFDRQILRLQSLKILDLSDNKISYLPKELGTLPHLQQLLLSQNNLGKSAPSKWAWLEHTTIRKNLHFLDISSNSITELPVQLKNMNALVELRLSQNMLTRLPHSIGTLRNLKILDVSKNDLSYLPGSVIYLRFQTLDISENPIRNAYDNKSQIHGNLTNIKMQSLVEWSAKCVLKSRIMYKASVIPYTLVDYLDEAKYCHKCKNPFFDSYVRKFTHEALACEEIKTTWWRFLKFECYFCSLKCAGKYKINFPY